MAMLYYLLAKSVMEEKHGGFKKETYKSLHRLPPKNKRKFSRIIQEFWKDKLPSILSEVAWTDVYSRHGAAL